MKIYGFIFIIGLFLFVFGFNSINEINDGGGSSKTAFYNLIFGLFLIVFGKDVGEKVAVLFGVICMIFPIWMWYWDEFLKNKRVNKINVKKKLQKGKKGGFKSEVQHLPTL
jgi:hypothetical protein